MAILSRKSPIEPACQVESNKSHFGQKHCENIRVGEDRDPVGFSSTEIITILTLFF